MKCPCRKDCPHRSCNCRSVCREFQEYDRQRIAGYAARDRQREKRWQYLRLVVADLTGMLVLRKERFKYAVVCNHGIRRSGVAITEMSGGDRECRRVKPANSLVLITSASSATSALVNALNVAGIPWRHTADAGNCSRRDV